MSIIRSDNRLEKHPKPVQEYERRFNGFTWVDWTSFAEMELVYEAVYRLNKFFWVNSVYYHCYGDGLYRPVSGSGSGNASIIDVIVANTDSNIDVPELDGKTFYMANQAGMSYNREYITQDNTNLDFTNVGGVMEGQRITIFYQ